MRGLVVAAALFLGGAAGYLARPVPLPVPAPAPAPRICVEPARGEPASCAQVELATRWCEASLSAMEAPARLVLAETESPPELPRQLRAAFSSCGIPAEIVQSDCRELPCVISLRLRDAEAVEQAAAACPALQELGYGQSGEVGPLVQQWPVRCPDGSTETMGLLTRSADVEPLMDALLPRRAEDDFLGGYYALGQIGRRAEQLAGSWPCGG